MKIEKPKITLTKNDTIVVKYKGKRFELYFDRPTYDVFIGEPGNGSLAELPLNGRGHLEFWPRW